MPVIAKVIFNLSLDQDFDYLVPDELVSAVRVGSRVRVALRRSMRSGYVIALTDHSAFNTLSPILALESDREQIPQSLIWLAEWIADYYCCPKEQAVCAMLPAVVRSGEMKHKQALFVCPTLLGTTPSPERDALTARRKEFLNALQERGPMPLSQVQEEKLASASMVAELAKDGWVSKELRVVERDPFMDDILVPDEPKHLTDGQAAALKTINDAQDAADSQVLLLHGVTASGKTEVYLQAIAHCLELGKEAIVLVPEISLTPQTCERFRRRFGNRVSVLHSGLSEGERFDEWTRINEGRSSIAVGARSALFAPMRNLGLIVVDEEHEPSYKQDSAPRYNARDMAVVRGKHEGATILLGSATPSLESYFNCERGRYKLIELLQRVEVRPMPPVELIDMAQDAAMNGKSSIFSKRLKDEIFDRLCKSEQVILFLNRRGYATQLMCSKCGYVAMCENCSIAYTYHKHAGALTCHLCGAEKPAPQVCPNCGDEGIRFSGYGTEKIETIVQALFPRARIARMDADTMTTKDCYRRVLEDFRGGKYDILIGTQMIAKGLDFPKVTLVGVIQADIGLHLPDFRSGERTFQLITQVAGRAGRGETPGNVIVQTFTPYHAALQCAVKHDFKGFYNEEIPSRKMLEFPPAAHMVIIHFRSQDEKLAQTTAEHVAEKIAPFLDERTQVIGPMPSSMAKVQTFYRYQIMYRGGNIWNLMRKIRPIVLANSYPKGVFVFADVDPRDLM